MSDALTQDTIARLVPEGAHVLDLGCGDGALLEKLVRQRRCTGYGIEIDDANVLACVQRGVNVLQLNLHEGLRAFQDQSFDIVAFPNFAHWPNRLSIARGRMPVTRRLPYQWYDTPNIRVGTFRDFEALAKKNGLKVLDAFGLQDGRVVRWLPNARASTAVFKLARG